MRQGVNMRTWPQAEGWAPASPRSNRWTSNPASSAASAASSPIGPAPTIARLFREGVDMPVTLPELGDDRGVVGGTPRAVKPGDRGAAATVPAAPGEPVESQVRAALGAPDQRLSGGPAKRPADLRHPNELQTQRGLAIHVWLPREARLVQRIEQRLARAAPLRPAQAAAQRRLGPGGEHQGAERGVPPATAIERMRVEVAADHDRPTLVLQAIEQRLHLPGAVAPGAMHLEMGRDADERRPRAFDVRHQGDEPPVHALGVELEPVRTREHRDARRGDRPP